MFYLGHLLCCGDLIRNILYISIKANSMVNNNIIHVFQLFSKLGKVK